MTNKQLIALFLLLTAGYAGLALFGPVDPATLTKYHLSLGRAHLVTLTVVGPIVMIWLTALYGSLRFRYYAAVIKNTKEGRAFWYIALGITLLAFSLPANGLINSILSAITVKHPHFLSASTIIKNYLNLLLPAIGILVINKGSSLLISTLKKNKIATWPPLALPGIIALSSLYTWRITTRTFGVKGDVGYFLPNWLILLTLAIPYLYVWCRGMLSAYKLFVYKRSIRGVIYKKSLDYLAKGIATIIILSVLTQLITTLSARLSRLNLTPILLIVYVLVALNALGYGLVARGATKLKQIEEV